jgi:ribosomal protein RSM22 (predicted rRNA methylase)
VSASNTVDTAGTRKFRAYTEGVRLPEAVQRSIGERAEALDFATLKRAAAAMSEAYREGRVAKLDVKERVAAYLVTRMPATYAAAYVVLREVRERIGPVAGILDAGAGTGAASLAAREFWPEASLTLVELDAALAAASRDWLPDAELIPADFRKDIPRRDLVIAAYSLGEAGASYARHLWDAAERALVVIEPGTPRGFAAIREVRKKLLGAGAHIVAPCPAESDCPVADPDWCHFAARVERSSLHRRVKGGELGHEDEKYSYIAFSHDAVPRAQARILRHPQHSPGLIVLETCTPEGLRTRRVSKRDRESFRAARRAQWGQAIDS